MNTTRRLLGGMLALIVALLVYTAPAHAANVQTPVNADEDTVTALNSLFQPEMTAPEVIRLLGSPNKTIKIDQKNYTAVYRGVLYTFDRSPGSRISSDVPIQVKKGDFQPGSLTVSFTYKDGKVSAITAE